MKHILMTLTLVFSAFTAHAVEQETFTLPETMQAGTLTDDGTIIQVEAKGLVCDFCARALEKVFMKQDGVTGIDVDLDQKLITIALSQGIHMDDETITKLIVDSGYNVGEIHRQNEEASDE